MATLGTFIGKMQKKSNIMKSGLDAMPLCLLDDLLRCPKCYAFKNECRINRFWGVKTSKGKNQIQDNKRDEKEKKQVKI